MNIISYYAFAALNKLKLREIYGYNIGEYIYMDPGAKVTEGICIGSLSTATSESCLAAMNIDAIVNLSGTDYQSSVPVYDILMDDVDVVPQTMESYIHTFADGVDAISTARRAGKNVLVHCAAGVNRSATLIAFYLIEHGWTYTEAIEALSNANQKRAVPLLTNHSFRYLLQAYDSFKRNFHKK